MPSFHIVTCLRPDFSSEQSRMVDVPTDEHHGYLWLDLDELFGDRAADPTSVTSWYHAQTDKTDVMVCADTPDAFRTVSGILPGRYVVAWHPTDRAVTCYPEHGQPGDTTFRFSDYCRPVQRMAQVTYTPTGAPRVHYGVSDLSLIFDQKVVQTAVRRYLRGQSPIGETLVVIVRVFEYLGCSVDTEVAADVLDTLLAEIRRGS